MKIYKLVLVALLFSSSALAEDSYSESDLYCMAENIYHESGNQSLVGKVAVGLVVLNRTLDSRWPSTICDVVKEGPLKESWKTKQDPNVAPEDRVYYPIKHRCQFSWWCDGKPEYINKNSVVWKLSLNTAYKILYSDKYHGLVEGATFYHADYVSPSWRLDMTLVTQIDNHIFYRKD